MVAVQEHLDLDRAVALQHKKGNGKGKERWRLYLARRKRRGVRRVKHAAVAGGAGRGGGRRAVAVVEGSGDGSGGGGRGTAGACVARAVSGFPGGGFEFLLGPFCVPPKLTLCFQFFSLFLLPFGFVFVIM